MGAVLSAPFAPNEVPEASSSTNDVIANENNQQPQQYNPIVHATTTTGLTTNANVRDDVGYRQPNNNDDSNSNKPKMSKNKMKRLAKEEKYRVLKKARRAEKKAFKAARLAEKRAERAEAFAALSPEERDELQRARIASMKAGRVDGRQRRAEVRRVISECTTYGIAIDLSWTSDMHPKELRSLARQLSYSYSILRKVVESGMQPVKLSLVNLDETMKTELTAAASGWDVWPVNFTSTDADLCDDNGNTVYLTHDSENVITELRPECTYVIGGIVDRNRLKGATARKAEKLGMRTARFNLDEVISLQKGTRVLTVNHCVDILLQVRNGKSWKEAYLNVLPERKGVSKEEDEKTMDDTAMDDTAEAQKNNNVQEEKIHLDTVETESTREQEKQDATSKITQG